MDFIFIANIFLVVLAVVLLGFAGIAFGSIAGDITARRREVRLARADRDASLNGY